jgi:hypothetical protein
VEGGGRDPARALKELALSSILRFDRAGVDARIGGLLVTPEHAGWDQARTAWNLVADQQPAAVALPETAEDVMAVVALARHRGLRIAPQGTGHGAVAIASLEQTILLKTSRMRRVDIDVAGRRARVEAGAEWQNVTVPAGAHGLAALAGSSPDVGVVGYTLGGGVGWLAREHGLACNHVLAIEVVTADGRMVRATAEEEPELFWALRGGGGSFGVVTAMEIELLPIAEVFAGSLIFPWDRGQEVLHAWREWTATVPDTVTSVGRFMQLPPIPEIPEPFRGRQLAMLEAAVIGDAATGAGLVAPLRGLGAEVDTFAMIPAPALSHLHMDPEEPSPGMGGHQLLADLPAEALDELIRVAGPGSGSSLLSVEVRHLGGALASPPEGCGALGAIDGEYMYFGVGLPMTPELGVAIAQDLQRVGAAMARWGSGSGYANFTEEPADSSGFFPAETYARLRRAKSTYDPGDLFLANHPIPPA